MNKYTDVFYLFLEAFCTDFESPNPSKWGFRLHETLIFKEAPIPAQYRFLIKNGAQTGAEKASECLKKSIKKSMHFFINKYTEFIET